MPVNQNWWNLLNRVPASEGEYKPFSYSENGDLFDRVSDQYKHSTYKNIMTPEEQLNWEINQSKKNRKPSSEDQQLLALNSQEAWDRINKQKAALENQDNPPVELKMPEVAQQAAGSGMSDRVRNELRNSQKRNQEEKIKEIIGMTPEDLRSVEEAFYSTGGGKELKSGIEQEQKQIEDIRNQPVDDYSSPLRSLLKFSFGRELPESEKPYTTQDKIKMLMAYQQKAQDDKRDVAKALNDFLKARQIGTLESKTGQTDDLLKMALAERLGIDPNKFKKAGTDQEAKAIRDIQKTFNKLSEPFNKSLNFSNEVESLIKNQGPGSRLSKKTVETILARARGEVGNLSYYEQAGTAIPQDILSRLTQGIETLTTGELTPDSKKEILGLVKQYKNAANEALKNTREIHATQGAEAYGNLGLGKERFKQALTGADVISPVKSEQKKRFVSESELSDYAKKKGYDIEKARKGLKSLGYQLEK